MDFNIAMRKKQLENLDQFILSSENEIQNVLDTLKWKSEEVMKDHELIVCSVDPGHRVPKPKIETHMEKCVIKKEGYDLKEKFLSEPKHDPQYSIYIDDIKKAEILSAMRKGDSYFKQGWNGQDPDPKTSDRLTSVFSTDERLALYNYSIANTKPHEKLPEFDVTYPKPEDTKELTYEEILTLERNAKRRRIKYRSVHTKKKKYTEIMREVIDGQMQLYEDWLSGDVKPKEQYLDSKVQEKATGESTKNDHDDADHLNAGKKSSHLRGSRSTSRKRDFDRTERRRSRESWYRSDHRENGRRSRDRSRDRYRDKYRKVERNERHDRDRHRNDD